MYLWGKPDWPTFSWDETSLSRQLAHASREQGRLLGKMEALSFDLRSEAHLRTLTEDVARAIHYISDVLALSRMKFVDAVILIHYFSGNTCFQSFFISTIIQPLASAWSRALSSLPT